MSDQDKNKPIRTGQGRGMMSGPMGGHGMPVQKAKNFKGTLKRLAGYLKPFKINLLIVLIFAIASTIFTIGAPQITRNAMNKLQDSFMARMVLNQVSEIQQKIRANVQQQMEKGQEMLKNSMSGEGAAVQNPVPRLEPGTIAALRDFMQLPLLNSVETAAEKADICIKIYALMKTMPALQGEVPQGEAQKRTLSGQQIEDALRAVRETGGRIDFTYLAVLVLILLGVYLISSLFTLIMQLVMVGVSQKTVYQLRKEVDNKLSRLPLKYFDARTHGEILSRVTNDIDTISATLQQSLTQVITSVISILGYIIMMLTISAQLTLVVLITLPLYIMTTLFITKRSQKYFAAQQKELGALSGHVEEMYTGHKLVKVFSREKASVEKFKGINEQLYKAGWKAQFVSGIMFPMMNFISNLGYVFISVIGGIAITHTMLQVGDITAFIQYSRQFTMPIIQTANIANIIQSTIACAERVFEVLDEEELVAENSQAQPLIAPEGTVSFEKVDFRYKEDTPLIENMNLDVCCGHTIAIVGPTGAGKTTLVNLLMRFYEIDKGVIKVENRDIRDLKRTDLRSLLGMVLQDTWLFNGTIRDNIAYGREGATEEEIIRAARTAYADHFIRTLPEGYNTVLNEEATNISQGQKQLLTIARAILSDPVILILDEATSNVDTRTEVLIRKAMTALMQNRTCFVIAHRLSTIRDAEMILVMNNGKIIEQGNHEVLLAQNGFYADLYNSQFMGANLKS